MATVLDGKRIGFVGAGAMAEALSGGLLAAGVPADRLCAADPDPVRRKRFEEHLGIRGVADNEGVVGNVDAVVLAVKPAAVSPVLAALAGGLGEGARGPLWISIAAGIPLSALEEGLGDETRAVRAMPNTPALVGAGATALCANAHAQDGDLALARALFDTVGTTWIAPTEALLDAVTGLSGSGPAYVFVFVEALADAGVRMGIPPKAALELATQTVFGSARLLLETGRQPTDLREQVTSPGGTTVAGLERLEAGGFRSAIDDAVAAATARSRELGSG